MAESDSGAFVREVLDHAIASVAEEEYCRLAEGMSLKDQTVRVDNALGSLMELQKGNEPNYDSEWVSLFYLTWFQPRQVHLAYTALREHISERNPPRQVIDFGCGAGAVQIALAILIADLAADKPELQRLAVHGIDSNEPMRRIGEAVWGKFREIVQESSEHPFLEPLRVTVDSMSDSCSTHASYEAYAESHAAQMISPADNCWFTAVHAVYQSNREFMRSVFGSIRKHQEPVFEVVTYYRSSGANLPSFFRQLGFVETGVQAVWSGRFPTLDSWRSQLALKLPGLEKIGLLRARPVAWDPDLRIARGEDVVMIRSGAE